MTAADAGVIAAIALVLLCLRRRRCPEDRGLTTAPTTAAERREQNEILMNLEVERTPRA